MSARDHRGRLGKRAHEFAPDEDAYLVREFRHERTTLLEMARHLGVTLSAVRRRLGELRELGRVGYRQRPVRGAPKLPRAINSDGSVRR